MSDKTLLYGSTSHGPSIRLILQIQCIMLISTKEYYVMNNMPEFYWVLTIKIGLHPNFPDFCFD
jgi:hypothetical protein